MINPLESLSGQNPLLEIETSFSAYLSARTRSFKDHVVGGRLDYAFDADFHMRQKINNLTGWSKIYKSLVGNDIPNKFKKVFQSTSVAGSLLFPNAYEAAKICAERLQISVPNVYVRNAAGKLDIYSISAPDVEDCIVITSGLYEVCTKEEMIFLIGRECGHIQNNHCIYNLSASYFGYRNEDGFSLAADNSQTSEGTLKQLDATLLAWSRLADVTSDRAGIICLDNPHNFPEIMDSIYQKGIISVRNRLDSFLDLDNIRHVYESLHITPARNIKLDENYTAIDRRIFAGLEFLNCEAFYNWRTDLNKNDIHTMNKQALEVRCEIIIGSAKEGA